MSRAKTKGALLVVVTVLAVCIVGYLLRAHQLSVEAQQQQAEIERRLAVCNEIYHAIYRYKSAPDFLTRHEAMVAKDRSTESDIGEKRAGVLHKYWRDVETCRTEMAAPRRLLAEEIAACKQTTTDGITAIEACAERDLDFDPSHFMSEEKK